jgi:hypothetical protein
LTAAAACSEIEADLGEGEGVRPLKATEVSVAIEARDIVGEAAVDLGGGRELRSGAMLLLSGELQALKDNDVGNRGERKEKLDATSNYRMRSSTLRLRLI